MLKHRSSSAEIFSSDYFFAVYPVSMQFQRDQNTRINIYFQKNLQIISKHQCPFQFVKKDQKVQFPVPDSVPHFRVQSQKSLDYSWSLYVSHIDMEGENEQFIEGQKVNLKQEWSAFKSERKSLYEQKVEFNTIRCKLDYLVIIGSSNQQVLDLIQKYFSERIIVDQKAVDKISSNHEAENLQELKVQSNHNVQLGGKPIQNVEVIQNAPPIQEKNQEKNQINQEMKTSEVIHHGRNSLQLNSSPETKQIYEAENKTVPVEAQNIRLTNSQVHIGEQIQEIVAKKQNETNKQQVPSNPQDKNTPQQADYKNIRLTSSQLLNEKKQVIVPIYKQNKVILAVILLIILTLGGGFWALSEQGPTVPQNKANKKKAKQETNNIPKKKTKGKK